MQTNAQSALNPIRMRSDDMYESWIGFYRMTLVCALRGTDGIILAADTKASEKHEPFSIDQFILGSVTSTSHVSKIVTSTKHSIAVGFAETDEARIAAEILVAKLDSLPAVPASINEEIIRACEQACNYRPQLMPQERRRALCGSILYVNPDATDRPIVGANFMLYADGKFTCDPIPIADKKVIGYSVNSAIFFLEKYYSLTEKPQSVEQLALLAGHVIFAASQLSKERIEGLEIVVCKKDSPPQFVQADTIKAIRAKSDSILRKTEILLKPLPKISLSRTRG